ncbi:hypothetical protein Ancab_012517, partial [Ancistrocladus abbreviatus]
MTFSLHSSYVFNYRRARHTRRWKKKTSSAFEDSARRRDCCVCRNSWCHGGCRSCKGRRGSNCWSGSNQKRKKDASKQPS